MPHDNKQKQQNSKKMKKTLFLALAIFAAQSVFGQTFGKGDMVADLGIGVGTAQVVKTTGKLLSPKVEDASAPTFTQKLAFEYGVFQSGAMSIGIGGIIENAYGASHDIIVAGKYDYKYRYTMYKYTQNKGGRYVWSQSSSELRNRKGEGVARGTGTIDNAALLAKASFHYQFVDNLDTYATIGLGASAYTYMISPKTGDDNTYGFSADSRTLDRNDKDSKYQSDFRYNDLDHAEWTGDATKIRFAMAFFVGARYYLTSNWGIHAEIGLNTATFKKKSNTYDIFSIGASYKF